MPNAYGTEKYQNFRNEWNGVVGGEEWSLSNMKVYYFGKYKIQYISYYCGYEKDNDNFGKLRYELTVYRQGNEVYKCKDIYSSPDKFKFFFSYNGNDFFMFNKDNLYGYTILNLDTLEEINYFPSKVMDKPMTESFIISGAMLWNDILLLDGCYWAGPSMCYLLSLKTYKTYLIDGKEMRSIDENGIKIHGNILTLRYDDEDSPESSSYTYNQLIELLNEGNMYDL